jgi:Ca2+-binding RTX toxin-like protein
MASLTPDLENKNATNGDDFLFGGTGSDTISGLNGADTIHGLGGADNLNGDAQDDTLIGGTGEDNLDGGTGDDHLDGQDGNDTLVGGDNDDHLEGGGENDDLIGNKGFDHMSGGGENDTFIWTNGDGNDVDDGGSGQDILNIFGSEDSGDIFRLDPENAQTTLVFQRENLVPFNIQISNMETVNISGEGGDDRLTVGNLDGVGITALVFDGGDGTDTLDTTANQGVKVLAVGGAGADFFFGGPGVEELHGGDGADHFFSGAGDDIIDGAEGNDQIFTGSGNDTISAGAGTDVIVAGPGDDTALTGTGQDDIRYDLSPVAGGNDSIGDFQNFVDDLFLGGITQAQLDTNADGTIDDADDLAAYDAGTDTLTMTFNATDSLALVGVTSLSVANDITFV